MLYTTYTTGVALVPTPSFTAINSVTVDGVAATYTTVPGVGINLSAVPAAGLPVVVSLTQPTQLRAVDTNAAGNALVMPGGVEFKVGGILSGTHVSTVSSVAEIIQAIADIQPITVRMTQTAVITATNGDPIITGVSTGWRTTNKICPGDLWKPNALARYYKVKFVNSDTSLTLWEPYAGTTISAVSTAFTFYYLRRHSIIVKPGDYTVTGVDPIILKPGVDFVAFDNRAHAFSEGQSAPVGPFGNLSDNNFTNINWEATPGWGALDSMFASSAPGGSGVAGISQTAWAGIASTFLNCRVKAGNTRGAHAGGATAYPCIKAGTVNFIGLDSQASHAGGFGLGGAATATADNTRINFIGSKLVKVPDFDSGVFSLGVAVLGLFAPGGADLPATINVDNTVIRNDGVDTASTTQLGDMCGVLCYVPSAVCNITNSNIYMDNVSGSAMTTSGIYNGSTGRITITNTSIEAVGTSGTGIRNTSTGRVDVRAGCRIAGSTAGITSASGTVNVSPNADVIGGSTGTTALAT